VYDVVTTSRSSPAPQSAAPVRRVLSPIPAKYDDMWTGAQGFYNVEPIVADGGQVALYAPHIPDIATTHPAIA
jgi:lactate racemase